MQFYLLRDPIETHAFTSSSRQVRDVIGDVTVENLPLRCCRFFGSMQRVAPQPEASRRVFGLLDTQLTESQPARVTVRAESRLKA